MPALFLTGHLQVDREAHGVWHTRWIVQRAVTAEVRDLGNREWAGGGEAGRGDAGPRAWRLRLVMGLRRTASRAREARGCMTARLWTNVYTGLFIGCVARVSRVLTRSGYSHWYWSW